MVVVIYKIEILRLELVLIVRLSTDTLLTLNDRILLNTIGISLGRGRLVLTALVIFPVSVLTCLLIINEVA